MNGMLTTDFKNPTIITAQQYDTKVSVEIDHSDTDIDELFEAFHTLVIGLGYSEDSWKQSIIDKADEYAEEDNFEGGFRVPTDEEIEAAFLEHNAHQEGFDVSEFDDYGAKINKK